jgi:rod shape-determining protein MreC
LSSQHQQKTVIQSVPLKTATLRATPAVLILLSLTLMALHRADTLPVERLRVAVADMTAPLLTAASAPFAVFVESMTGMSAMHDLKAQNIRLTEENEKLQKWYEAALKMQAENASLRQLLNVKADPAIDFVTARVISDAGGSFVKSVLLPVGLRDKVQKGSAVMSGQGLVGRIVELGQSASRVLLVTDLNSHIPVVLQGTRIKAILAGQNKGTMKLERLPPDSGLAAGMRVVTSGDGGQLPPDLPIGIISSIGEEGVIVTPLSDIDGLSYVQVVNAEVDPALATGDLSDGAKSK